MPKRATSTSFQTGNSGNPKGHSKEYRQRRAAAKEHLDKLFAAKKEGDPDQLAQLIYDGAVSMDPACIRMAAEYRWGRPAQQHELSGPDGGPLMSIDLSGLGIPELVDRARVALLRLEAHNGRSGSKK